MAESRPSPLNRMIGAIVPRAVDALDPDELIERLDLDAVLARVDLNQLLDRIDVDALMARIDVNALIGRVDVNELVAGVDVDALVARIDVDALMARVDVDALVARVDINGLVDQVDIAALVARAGIDQIVADATSGIATRTLDLGRRQLLGIDLVALGLVDRVVRRRKPATAAPPPPWSAGPLSRLLAFFVDTVTVSALFGLGVSLIGVLVGLFTNRTFDGSDGSGLGWITAFGAWWFAYLWLTIAISGRTIGKGLVGLRVVALDGSPLRPGAAARRALAFPFSFLLGLGFVPAVVGVDRRALHDHLAGSRVVVDWGAREVTPPAGLARWTTTASSGPMVT